MSEGAITVVDGKQLSDIDLSLPLTDVGFTGAQVLDLADSRATSSLYGIDLPEPLRSSALSRIALNNIAAFKATELTHERASQILKDYISAIADELGDDPLVVSNLDGKTLRMFLDDEDDFAMIAENLFTDLDTEDKGKIKKSEIQKALVHMGVEMGVPPLSEYPLLSDILLKHEVESDNELGQAQFAEVLQPILQELADALAKKHYVFIQNIKISNGSRIKKLLANEKQFNNLIEEIWQESHEGDGDVITLEKIRNYCEKKWKVLGLPPSEANEAVVLLYDAIFSDVENDKSNDVSEKSQFGKLVKEILETFAEQLEASPVYYDFDLKLAA